MKIKELGRAACGALLWCLAAGCRAESALEIDYSDQDDSTSSYVTRILVTERFVRMDYGQDKDDFVLLDRAMKRVYNVTRERREIMIIDAGAAIAKPEKWALRDEVTDDLDGAKKHIELYVNDVLCSRITAAPALLPEAVSALAEFRQSLAEVQASTYLATPAELRSDCDLAQNVLETARWLAYGLPLEEMDYNGATRRLINYQNIQVKPALFALPGNYRSWNMKESRGK